jgi:hypothetical protein
VQAFPSEYDTAIRQAQLATKAALADGHKLLEVRKSCVRVQGFRSVAKAAAGSLRTKCSQQHPVAAAAAALQC